MAQRDHDGSSVYGSVASGIESEHVDEISEGDGYLSDNAEPLTDTTESVANSQHSYQHADEMSEGNTYLDAPAEPLSDRTESVTNSQYSYQHADEMSAGDAYLDVHSEPTTDTTINAQGSNRIVRQERTPASSLAERRRFLTAIGDATGWTEE